MGLHSGPPPTFSKQSGHTPAPAMVTQVEWTKMTGGRCSTCKNDSFKVYWHDDGGGPLFACSVCSAIILAINQILKLESI